MSSGMVEGSFSQETYRGTTSTSLAGSSPSKPNPVHCAVLLPVIVKLTTGLSHTRITSESWLIPSLEFAGPGTLMSNVFVLLTAMDEVVSTVCVKDKELVVLMPMWNTFPMPRPMPEVVLDVVVLENDFSKE